MPLACKMGLFIFPAAGFCSQAWQGLAAGGRAGAGRGLRDGDSPQDSPSPFSPLSLPWSLCAVTLSLCQGTGPFFYSWTRCQGHLEALQVAAD